MLASGPLLTVSGIDARAANANSSRMNVYPYCAPDGLEGCDWSEVDRWSFEREMLRAGGLRCTGRGRLPTSSNVVDYAGNVVRFDPYGRVA